MKVLFSRRYVLQTAQLLLEVGGAEWLLGLRRSSSLPEVRSALCTLRGVGPKVADRIHNQGTVMHLSR